MIAECKPCPNGTFSDTPAAYSCQPCPTGRFCPVAAALPLQADPAIAPTSAWGLYGSLDTGLTGEVTSQQPSVSMVDDAKRDSLRLQARQ